MVGTHYFGYLLVALSAFLLAQHWHLWRDASLKPMPVAEVAYVRGQLQRRSVASGLIGVLGAAITLVDHVPRTPWSLTVYLVGLLLGATVILAIALVDMRAARRRREVEHLELVAYELSKALQRPVNFPPIDEGK